MAAARQPPPFVPTLTDVVAPGFAAEPRAAADDHPVAPPSGPIGPTAGDAPPPAARAEPHGGYGTGQAVIDEACLDELVDRIMLRVQPLLQQRLQATCSEWLTRRLAEEAAALAAPLVNDLADIVRDEVLQTLGATRNGNRFVPD